MTKKSEIVIKPAHVVIMLLAFVLLMVGGYALYPTVSRFAISPGPQEAAARVGAEAFLNRDVRQGQAAWVQAVCAVSTEGGCRMMSALIAPLAWPAIEGTGMQAVCEITHAAQYMAGEIANASLAMEAQVWKLTGSCAFDGTAAKSGDLFVMVVKEGETWKFDHVIFEQELRTLEAK